MPPSFYSQHSKFYVAVDCIIFGLIEGRVCVLLTRRQFEPAQGQWSLMGGFVEDGESVDQAAQRVLSQLTGLDNLFIRQLRAFGAVGRDPGERVISVAYYALIGANEYDAERLAQHNAVWTPIDQLPELCFDHPQMIDRALEVLREKIIVRPLVFNILPPLFTLTQLQQVYQTLLGVAIDKRNFRKRVAENLCIEKTDAIDKSSRRGASLYRYNEDIYKAYNNQFKL